MLDSTKLDPRALRNAFGRFATGVTVVTMRKTDGTATGVTVSSFSSLSLAPALCPFSLDRRKASCKWVEAGSDFVINVLSETQQDIAWQLAESTEEKLAGIATRPGALGIPVIDGSIARFECRLWKTYDGGDHLIVVGEILDFEIGEGEPMVFFGGEMSRIAS